MSSDGASLFNDVMNEDLLVELLDIFHYQQLFSALTPEKIVKALFCSMFQIVGLLISRIKLIFLKIKYIRSKHLMEKCKWTLRQSTKIQPYTESTHIQLCLDSQRLNQKEQTAREQLATQTLLSLTQVIEGSKNIDKIRQQNNGSEITCWKQNYLNILNKRDLGKNRKHQKFRLYQKKCIPRQNPFLESQPFHFDMDISLRKQFDKIRLPLREKAVNTEQFSFVEGEKQRSKTRNDVMLEVISQKRQIAPSMTISKKRSRNDWKCDSIVKQVNESKQYQRIKRKQFYTCQNQSDKLDLYAHYSKKQKQRSLVIHKNYTPNEGIKLHGKSIKKLFSQ